MHAYTELLQPSVVTQSLILPVGHDNEELLFIVRGGSLLQVFDDIKSANGPHWIAEFSLQGTVTSLSAIAEKYLLLTSLQAKLVVLKWDHQRLAFVTKSLHFYERLKDKSNFDVSNFRDHRVSVDERNKCMMFWFQREYAAFLNFSDLVNPLLLDTEQTEIRAVSSIIKVSDVAAATSFSSIEDMVLLTEFREPTLAILGYTKPSWAGLVGADGEKTKAMSIVTLKMNRSSHKIAEYRQVLRVPEISYDASRIFPLRDSTDYIAILHCSDSFKLVSGSGTLTCVTSTEFGSGELLENAKLLQLPGSHYTVVSLDSGVFGLLNVSDVSVTKLNYFNTEKSGASTTCASTSTVVLASPSGNVHVCSWTSPENTLEEYDVSRDTQKFKSMQELYDHLTTQVPQKKKAEVSCLFQEAGQLKSIGPLSSVTSIDNGLACSTDRGIVIVERELSFDELTTAEPNTLLEPGKFWIVSSTVSSRPLLLTTYDETEKTAEDEEAAAAAAAPKKKRRRNAPSSRQHTRLNEIFETRRNKSRKPVNVPHGISSEQLTLAVHEDGTTVTVVQSKSIARFESGSWKLKKRVTIPVSQFAEIRGDHVLVQDTKDSGFSVYSGENLKLHQKIEGAAELASLSDTAVYTCSHGILTITKLNEPDTRTKTTGAEQGSGDLDDRSRSFDVGNLGKACYTLNPSSIEEIQTQRKEKVQGLVKSEDNDSSPNGESEQKEKPAKAVVESSNIGTHVNAIFALKFAGSHYVGIHVDRVFVIYESRGDMLIKLYSVPFGVNQSPIFLEENEMLVFPGAKSHVVVKGRNGGFQCHRLQLYGDRLIDVVCSLSGSKEQPRHEIVWLDDKDALHFAVVDEGIDCLNNKMPYRLITLDEPGTSIKDISYHDQFAVIMVGANQMVPFDAPRVDQATAEMEGVESANGEAGTTIADGQEEQEDNKIDEKDAPDAENIPEDGENVPELVADEDPKPLIGKGRVFVLPLTTYKFQPEPVVKFDEMLLCLNLVDYGDAGGKQMLAVGTASSTYETEETNGHIHVFKVEEKEEHEGADDRTESPTSQDDKSCDKSDDESDDKSSRSEDNDRESSRYHDDPPPVVVEPFADRYVRGAVSRITEVMGFLAVAQGQQILIYNFHKRLEPVGFFDTSVYMQDLKAVRNIMILGERLRGPRLVNFALNPHRLDQLSTWDALVGPNQSAGTDATKLPVTTAVEGISNALRGDLAIVHTEIDGRLQLFQYDPENPVSNGGHSLVPLASFYTGKICNSMIAVQLHANDDLIAYGITADGTLFNIKPLSEENFRAFFVLTQQMMDKEPAVAGMNPRSHRANLSTLQNHNHQLIDVNYAQNFWSLSLSRQAEYARRLGYEGLSKVRKALNQEGRDALKL